jgi:hypothetical protein
MRLIKLVNKKDKLKSRLIFDENKVSTTLGVQDFIQDRKDFGKEQADVIMNITANIISGQVTGDTAKQLLKRFGKIMKDRTSFSINRMDTSVSKSKQLDSAILPSKISALSWGEFVGLVADNPEQKIDLKAFHCEIRNDHQALKNEQDEYQSISIIRKIDQSMVLRNYMQIKQDVLDIAEFEIQKIIDDPALQHLMI